MIEKMTRFDFILLSSETDEFLSAIQELGVVDITRSVKAVDEKSARELSEADALKKRIDFLSKSDWAKDEEYSRILSEISYCKAEVAECTHWGDFDRETLSALEEAGAGVKFYCVSKKKFNPEWEKDYPLQIIDESGDGVRFIIAGASGIPVPESKAPQHTLPEAESILSGLKKSLSAREQELKAIDIESLRREYCDKISAIDKYLAGATLETEAEGTLTVVTGFAPSEKRKELEKEFDSMDVYYMSGEAEVEDNPPIRLQNIKFVRMFEVLTDMYGRPAYDGFDPTPYISIFFLLFFAMCMGDAGYGIILAAIGFLLKKSEGFAKLSPLVITLGIATFVVGFFFHTFFSVDISTWSIIPDSLKSIMVPAKVSTYDGTMVLALLIGIIHLCLAMVVKTIYATKNKGFINALGTWGWTLFIVGSVVAAAFALAGVIDAGLTRTIIIILGCVSAIGIFLLNDIHRNPLLNIGSGLWEAYNTATGILGDVLSYLRLYALGLAGGMLGFAFNDLAKMALGDGGYRWIFFILIALIGHTLNIAMAALGAFVHPLRLNFLEFFKNSGYEGSGRNYNPLKKNN